MERVGIHYVGLIHAFYVPLFLRENVNTLQIVAEGNVPSLKNYSNCSTSFLR